MKKAWLIILLLLAIIPHSSVCQVIINEICSKNASLYLDEDGDDPDWFEIYNSSVQAIPLKGLVVTDAGNSHWSFPDTLLPPGSFILIFASGKNRAGITLHTSFRLSDDGDALVLKDAAGKVLDAIAFGHLAPNHSFGRKSDGNTPWVFYSHPSPGSSNNYIQSFSGYAPTPVVSAEAGFYPSPLTITMDYDSTLSCLHYTLDGSVPTDTSLVYTGPVMIDSTKVFRTQAFSRSGEMLPSDLVTRTYFIGFSTTLPVFSISTDPGNLWDWDHGIYVKGPNASPYYPYYGANYWQDWEIPAHVEFFETNKVLAISQEAGVSINGGSVSRTRPMQSLRLTAREEYGNSRFNYRLFHQKKINRFKNIVLRNSSGDYNKTHFRDGALHSLMIGNVNIDLLCYRPSVIFINGKYWGIQNIREKFSKFYLEENHGIDPDALDLLEEDSTIIQGDFTDFNRMYDFITSRDLSIPLNYDSASRLLDINSFCDYVIAETFLSNIDWPYNNIKYWKEKSPGNRWRYLLMDLDISLGNYGWAPSSMDVLGRMLGTYGDLNRHVLMLRSLLNNAGFRNYFINRYADLVNTLFSAENMRNHIEQVKSTLEPEMPRHFDRWGNSMETWNFEIDSVVMPYIETRPAYSLQYLQELFQLENQVQVALECWPPEAGTIRINTIEPDLPFTGTYFNGVPVSLMVIPGQGSVFTGWIAENSKIPSPSNPSIQMNISSSDRIIAYFGPDGQSPELGVFPNPAKDLATIFLESESAGKGSIEIYNLAGQRVFSLENLDMNPGLDTLNIRVDHLSSGIYLVKVLVDQKIKTARLAIIR